MDDLKGTHRVPQRPAQRPCMGGISPPEVGIGIAVWVPGWVPKSRVERLNLLGRQGVLHAAPPASCHSPAGTPVRSARYRSHKRCVRTSLTGRSAPRVRRQNRPRLSGRTDHSDLRQTGQQGGRSRGRDLEPARPNSPGSTTGPPADRCRRASTRPRDAPAHPAEDSRRSLGINTRAGARMQKGQQSHDRGKDRVVPVPRVHRSSLSELTLR